ncbi:MAG: type II toxin-antitoxin system VapC family toxin, partial [Verrucomicrobiota bacterium]|nr:type II toxin-antitoxin system VapC family toxin [Verrucomicrobiota bacterium]
KLTDQQAKEILQLFETDEQTGVWIGLSVDSSLLNATCVALEKFPSSHFLRSGDAIHLTCAQEHGFKEIYSSDKHLLAAASYFGLIGKIFFRHRDGSKTKFICGHRTTLHQSAAEHCARRLGCAET